MARTIAAAVGTGVTVFLFVTVLVIESLAIAFSAIVALPVGLLAGLLTGILVARRYARLSGSVTPVVDGIAGFGGAVLVMLGLRYVAALGLRSVLSFERVLALAAATALALAIASWLFDR